jgi:hypothetical protein
VTSIVSYGLSFGGDCKSPINLMKVMDHLLPQSQMRMRDAADRQFLRSLRLISSLLAGRSCKQTSRECEPIHSMERSLDSEVYDTGRGREN